MLTKFDSKSNRVKGLSFHPKRPWILSSLHNGVIQLWDYRIGVLLDRYEEHEGPVRGIDFHRTQPLFVSGGDDYKIKVWNYKLRRCLFTLLGHLDYIRTVQFHSEHPWIVSASDDQTIRIWNWQSRNCLSVLTGHNHYVMCASFHPREDLVVSASLDQTVRVWDTSGLRRKSVRGAPADESSGGFGGRSLGGTGGGDSIFGGEASVKYVLEGHDRGVNWAAFHPTQNLIVSGADDRQVKLWRMNETKAWEMDTLRGHTNNVSCVMFHPRHDLVISDSEDRSIRVWDVQRRMCIDTYRRAGDRFWILAVHPEQALIAAGHDSGMLVFKLERERPAFASLGGNQLFYVRDRFLRRAILTPGAGGGDVPLISLRPRAAGGSPLGASPRGLTVNPHAPDEVQVLLTSSAEGGSFELYNLSLSSDQEPIRGACLAAVFSGRSKFTTIDRARNITVLSTTPGDPGKKFRPPYATADFLFPASTPGRVLIRGSDDRVCLFELQSRRIVAEIASISVKYAVWSADGKYVALLGKHTVVLADKELTQITSVSEIVRVKSGCWDAETGVFLYTTLNHIKYLLPIPPAAPAPAGSGGASAGTGAGAGATAGKPAPGAPGASDIVVAPAPGDGSGIVRTLDAPVYAVEARGGILTVLDRDARVRSIPLDSTEYSFKLALARGEFARVLSIIKTARLCGQAVIAYLQRSGYPEIALFFVEDEGTRFNLALECGNLDVALKAARALNAPAAWSRLAAEALRLGNLEVVEAAFQTTKALDRLSFLYLATGASDKLGKMATIAGLRGDAHSRFHNALFTGAVDERVRVLEGAGQLALAYTTAATHGLEADAARLRACLEEAGLPVPALLPNASLMLPPTPLLRAAGSWPTAKVTTRGAFDPAAMAAVAAVATETVAAATGGARTAQTAAVAAAAAASLVAAAAEREAAAAAAAKAAEKAAAAAAAGGSAADVSAAAAGGGWGDDDDLGLGDSSAGKAGGAGAGADGAAAGGGWGDDDLGLDLGDAGAAADTSSAAAAGGAGAGRAAGGWAPPAGGTAVPARWVAASTLAADHAAAGSFESAMTLLHRQLGIVDFSRLRDGFIALQRGSRVSLPTLPGLPPLPAYLMRPDAMGGLPTLPALAGAVSIATVQERLRALSKAFTDGQFAAVDALCNSVFATVPLLVAQGRAEAAEIKRLVAVVAEYKLACRIMMTAKATDPENGARQVELAAYMTHCSLEPAHLMLALNLAAGMGFKQKCFIAAAGFARRLLEMPDINSARNAALLQRAKAILAKSEAEGRNAFKLNYDEKAMAAGASAGGGASIICAASLTPIPRGGEAVRSPYSGASYLPQYRGSVCVVDGMAQVGVEALGLVHMEASRK